jgi:glycine oxidase
MKPSPFLVRVFYFFCVMTDYLIVGCGLSGIAFAEKALQQNKSFVVFEDKSQNSSRIAAGLYNPVILKRFTSTFQAQEQLDCMNSFYDTLETRLKTKFLRETPILRRFFSIEEQNNWFDACDKPALSAFLSPELINEKFDGLNSPFGFGRVMRTGWVNTQRLLEMYKDDLFKCNNLYLESFDYSELVIGSNSVIYKQLEARHIVFCEGYGIHSNPLKHLN